jgi:hypothetical protein
VGKSSWVLSSGQDMASVCLNIKYDDAGTSVGHVEDFW